VKGALRLGGGRAEPEHQDVDEGIIRRSLFAVLWFGVIVVVVLHAHGAAMDFILGLVLGAAVMSGAVAALAITVRAAIDPERPRTHLVVAVFLLKLPVVAGALYLIVRYTIASGAGLAVGIGLPILVILCKFAGRALGSRSDRGR